MPPLSSGRRRRASTCNFVCHILFPERIGFILVLGNIFTCWWLPCVGSRKDVIDGTSNWAMIEHIINKNNRLNFEACISTISDRSSAALAFHADSIVSAQQPGFCHSLRGYWLFMIEETTYGWERHQPFLRRSAALYALYFFLGWFLVCARDAEAEWTKARQGITNTWQSSDRP